MLPLPFWTIYLSVMLVSAEFLKLDFTRAPIANAPLGHRSLGLPITNDLPYQVSVPRLKRLQWYSEN
jgi:hypothetical protein